jgi:hypothetical protein
MERTAENPDRKPKKSRFLGMSYVSLKNPAVKPDLKNECPRRFGVHAA